MNFSSFGGHGPGQAIYERQFNLMYMFIYPTKTTGIFDKKVKTDFGNITNIMVYDIPKDAKTMLFEEGELNGEFIKNITFEQFYNAKEACIVFNNTSFIRNNIDIHPREPHNLLLIETHNPSTDESFLWLSDKWGFEKTRLTQLTVGARWHLDVFNDSIRIIEHLGTDINVFNFVWGFD